jgi:hypothetical protein
VNTASPAFLGPVGIFQQKGNKASFRNIHNEAKLERIDIRTVQTELWTIGKQASNSNKIIRVIK